jgi:RNA polymerase sigma-70 factor (ECF subfamily)
VDRAGTFAAERSRLFGIAYRMLGTTADADDVVQDAFLRWRRVPDDEIDSPRAFLSTIVTRLCIDRLRAVRAAREDYVGPWLPEPLVDDETPSTSESFVLAESLSLAFLVVLERLAPVERAVYLLREVFDYEYESIAAIVGKSEESCRQILRRARERVVAERPRVGVSDDERERLTRQFLATLATGDVAALVAMLARDAVLWSDGGGKTAAARNPIRGADRIARFFVGLARKAPPNFSTRFTRVNGQAGVVMYLGGRPYGVMAFDPEHGRIQAVRIVNNPDKLRAIPPLQ